ncbi:ISL3 family transposase, partial [Corynebacterium freneyi]
MQPTFNLVADTICRTAELGLTITDAADAGEFTVISARPIDSCDKCPGCGHTGRLRDHVVRRLT